MIKVRIDGKMYLAEAINFHSTHVEIIDTTPLKDGNLIDSVYLREKHINIGLHRTLNVSSGSVVTEIPFTEGEQTEITTAKAMIGIAYNKKEAILANVALDEYLGKK